MSLTDAELQDLREARRLLENPGLAAKISAAVGTPIEKGLALLPSKWSAAVSEITHKAIERALDAALSTIDFHGRATPMNALHKLAVGASGALGGAFGLPALAIELPVSTTLMLRSIADIARSQGEDLSDERARLECVQVLALGGTSTSDDAAETGYFAARSAMAKAVSEAARHLAQHGLSRKAAPPLVRLIGEVASRFSVNVSQKAAAQAIPVLGAVAGAALNTLFMDHFQDMARGHFTIRRLERAHGAQEIQRLYAAMDAGSS